MTTASASGRAGLLAELEWRGILHGSTPGLADRLASGRPIAGYNGFDPSADSLHIGHLVPIFGLLRFQRHGGRPVALVGGGTGMIGDPSGRSAERNLLDRETLEANVIGIRAQLERFLDFAPGSRAAVLVNNLDWLAKLSLVDFLRDTGKQFTIPYMLAKDSVQVRLDRGLSFTEFSYMLLQAYDFEHLYRTMGVELQMGGADQWGNITAGLELIRRVGGEGKGSEPAHGLAYRLLLSPSGAKFGKSETHHTIWLDPHRTSSYAFYQYWVTTDDRDVGTYLRWFTELDEPTIVAIEADHARRPDARAAQGLLARDITARVHGAEEADRVAARSEAVFGHGLLDLPGDEFEAAVGELPVTVVSAEESSSLLALALATGAYPSRGEARRGMAQGGFYVNDERLTDPAAAPPEPVHGRYWIVRTGRKHIRVARRA